MSRSARMAGQASLFDDTPGGFAARAVPPPRGVRLPALCGGRAAAIRLSAHWRDSPRMGARHCTDGGAAVFHHFPQPQPGLTVRPGGAASGHRGVGSLLLVRQRHAETRVLARLGGDAHAATGLVHEIAHQVHADAARGAAIDGGESGAEDESGQLARVDLRRFIGAENTLSHRFGADLVVIEATPVILHAELVTIRAGADELDGHRADLGLVLYRAVRGCFDAVTDRVVDELTQDFFDGSTVTLR